MNRNKKNFIFFILLLSFTNIQIKCNNIKVSLSLQNTEATYNKKLKKKLPTVYLNETFQIKATISSKQKQIEQVEIEGIDNLNVAGRSTATNMSIINGALTASINHIFDVKASKVGTFSIGPAKVTRNNNVIKSEPQTITFAVKKRPQGTIAKGKAQNNEYEVFAKLKINKKELFVGEPVILSIDTYSRGDVLQLGIAPPKFPGFTYQEIGSIKRNMEEVDNKYYNIYQKQYLLTPIEPGKKEINPINIQFQVRSKIQNRHHGLFDQVVFSGLFGKTTENKEILSNSLQVNIKPLPNHTQNIDGVGNFSKFQISTNKNSAMVNEPIELKLEIEGKGNLDQIVTPQLSLPNFITFYESKTDVQQDLSEGYFGGKKTFEFIVQISKPGECIIPKQRFVYFDTKSKNYKTLTTKPVSINITQPPRGYTPNQNTIQKNIDSHLQEQEPLKENKQISTDIHFIEEDVNAQKNKSNTIPLWLFVLLVLLSPIILFFSKITNLFKTKIFYNFFPQLYAPRFKQKLIEIQKNNNTKKLHKFFLEYLAYKLNININEIEQDIIEKKLNQTTWDQSKIDNFMIYLNNCASLSFASKATDKNYTKKLLDKSEYWFLLLESNFAKK